MAAPTSYQRVGNVAVTPSDYDSQNHPIFLRFDGVDDCLFTSAVDFTATDKMTVWSGVRKLANSATSIIAELSDSYNANTGSFVMFNGDGGSLTPYFSSYSRGTAGVSVNHRALSTDTFAAPTTNVLTAQHNIVGDLSILRINGAANGTNGTGDQGSGNFGNYPIYIGRRGNASLQWNGRLYSLIVRGAQSTDAQITRTEKWVNGKTKAYALPSTFTPPSSFDAGFDSGFGA